MCGIAGIIDYKSTEDFKPILHSMISQIRHRGPDASGIYTNGPAGLGHARLSILDLDTGDQPIHNEDRSVWVVFNGEIFNYPELRESLISKGHVFYTKSDTEVLVHLYEEYGANFLNFLNGQFAFAIWDCNKQEVLLGRDRVGIRPLFYYCKGQRIVFGSEIKAIFADRTIPRNLDIGTLSDIFTCWAPVGESSSFKDIKQIPPGHYAVFSRKGLSIRRYWRLPFHETEFDTRPERQIAEELTELLTDAVRIRLRADVPVGAYLSGGLDSTFITAIIKTQFDNRLKTFSVGFTDGDFDESAYQQQAVEYLGTDHQIVKCSEEDIADRFMDVIRYTETPVIRTAPAPLFILSGLVRENDFKVVLTGEGADEIFCGYNIFKEDKILRFCAKNPDSVIRPFLLKRLYPYIFKNGNGRNSAYIESFFKKSLAKNNKSSYSQTNRWRNTSHLKIFLSDNVIGNFTGNKIESADEFAERYETSLPDDFDSWVPMSKAQYTESTIFLSNYLLSSQGDRMAMGNSVEGRYPFLDHRVMEFAAKIPPIYRMRGLTEKYLLKKAAGSFIPQSILNRPKQPYRAPISKCFCSDNAPEYVHELLSEKAVKRAGYFEYKKVDRLLKKSRKQNGNLLSERENMAIVGILSTQILDYLFIRNFA